MRFFIAHRFPIDRIDYLSANIILTFPGPNEKTKIADCLNPYVSPAGRRRYLGPTYAMYGHGSTKERAQ